MSLLNKFFDGYANTYALAPGILDRLYVNEDWFNELSAQEIEFILAHELARIKHKDKVSNLALSTVLAAALYTVCPELLEGDESFSHKVSCIINEALNPGIAKWEALKQNISAALAHEPAPHGLRHTLASHLKVLSAAVFNRYQVSAADSTAATELNATAGAIEFLTNRHQCKIAAPWYRAVQGIKNSITYPIKYLPILKYWQDVPSNEDRKQNLPLA